MARENTQFELRGVNHIALVCKDMSRTVEFYSQVLGMPLTKTINMPGGGQHFFFDMGGNDQLAFFWFPDAHEAVPGVTGAGNLPGRGDISSAHGSMNHLAFDVPLEHFETYRQRLVDKGVEVSPIVDHDDSPSTVAKKMHPGVFVRSFYFRDPDGMLLEFASWCRQMGQEGDVVHDPLNAEGESVGLASVYRGVATV